MFTCPYCLKEYKSEARFIAHKCKEKERHEYVKTVNGRIAFSIYEQWMFIKYKKHPTIDQFLQTRYFKSFQRFAVFIRNIKGLADTELFLTMVSVNNLDPTLWCEGIVFKKYLNYLAEHTSPAEKIEQAIITLEKLSKQYNCELCDVFNYVTPYTINKLIYEQKLSPWILLNSSKFLAFLAGCDDEQEKFITDLIDEKVWVKKFTDNPKQVKIIRKCIKELGL
jgi:hypothetical protein